MTKAEMLFLGYAYVALAFYITFDWGSYLL